MTHLQEQLKDLRQSLYEMALLVKSQLHKAITALFDADEDLANEVLINEKRVNAFELSIDKDCENIFALLTPVAHDMRFVFATLKINSDLERIGDYAANIARTIIQGKKDFDKALIKKIELKKMYDIADDMLDDVINAYINDDGKLSRSVFSKDVLLDEINVNGPKVIAEYCKNNPEQITQSLYLLLIMQRLERAGDHTTNIAEEIIFYKEAKVLKHVDKSKLTQNHSDKKNS